MKNVKTILVPMVGLFVVIVSTCMVLGYINFRRAEKEAQMCNGSDLEIAEKMQKYGFCQDGDVFREIEVWEVFVSGLGY